jgi:hypothetical protein
MQILPIGDQGFPKIRNNNMLYVDKTEQIHRLITRVRYCFLSRPRRFGKSLTLSTIEEIFSGDQALFEGLWIADRWDWSQRHPVIHIPFNKLDYQNKGLEKALTDFLDEQAEAHEITLKESSAKSKLAELVGILALKEAPVVLLIDEYDKPIIDYLTKEDLPVAKEHRKILKTFYGGLKDSTSQASLRFFMITGVSKFSQVSIFSDLNYLDDITIDENFSDLVGYTQTELARYFPEWLEHLAHKFPQSNIDELLKSIKDWYNGYSWDGETSVYNPFSILQLFYKRSFEDFWFKTGTPTFLVNLLKEQGYYELDGIKVSKLLFESYDLENMDVRSLLFQTGYLTIKHIDRFRGVYTLDYPNREVREAMESHLIALLTGRRPADSQSPVLQLEEAFLGNDIKKVVTIINAMLKDVPSLSVGSHDERFYHALVHLHFHYLGIYLDSEVHTSNGRMDAVVQTDTHTYIFEFKLDESAAVALQQIHEKQYAEKYRLNGKTLIGVGINFNSDKRTVDDWTVAVLLDKNP